MKRDGEQGWAQCQGRHAPVVVASSVPLWIILVLLSTPDRAMSSATWSHLPAPQRCSGAPGGGRCKLSPGKGQCRRLMDEEPPRGSCRRAAAAPRPGIQETDPSEGLAHPGLAMPDYQGCVDETVGVGGIWLIGGAGARMESGKVVEALFQGGGEAGRTTLGKFVIRAVAVGSKEVVQARGRGREGAESFPES